MQHQHHHFFLSRALKQILTSVKGTDQQLCRSQCLHLAHLGCVDHLTQPLHSVSQTSVEASSIILQAVAKAKGCKLRSDKYFWNKFYLKINKTKRNKTNKNTSFTPRTKQFLLFKYLNPDRML